MNAQKKINNLLMALSQKGKLYKINTFQTYLEEENKFIKKYMVLKRQLVEEYDLETYEFKEVYKFLKDKETYSIIDLLKYFAREYKESRGDS